MELTMIVETPKGSRNKYEIDQETGEITLDRTLYTATAFPCDYGFLPDTLGEDDDPLDVLILTDEPTFPGCRIAARVVGAFCMSDEHGRDTKVLCVPAKDDRKRELKDLEDVEPSLLEEIGHFFDVYKDLEPGKTTQTDGWVSRGEAERAVIEAQERARGESNPGG